METRRSATRSEAGPASPRGRRVSRRRERGQGLVEMSMILPLMLVMLIGLVEVADSFNSYITLLDAARDGARLGSKNLASDSEIKNLIVIETARLRDPVDPVADISIQHTTFDGDNVVRVTVCHNRQLLLNVPLIIPETFRMCGKTTMRVLPGQGEGGSPPPGPTNTPGPTSTPTPPPTNTPVPTNTPTRTPTTAPTPTPDSCPWWAWWC